MDVEDVGTIAVLGAGAMGHGIAEVAALAGFDVALRDVSEDVVNEGYDRIEWSLEKLTEKGRLSADDADSALDRVETFVDLAPAVADADVVVEAVPERLEHKREAFAAADEHAPDRAVFATNTSSLSVTAIAEATDRPSQVCGMHFFNPPVRMQLVEVVAGEESAAETLALAESLATAMGKTPVRVERDTPGFVVNRVLVSLLNEAAWMVEGDEASVAAVDSTAKYELGLPMGAFELADRVGIDVCCHVLEHMAAELGAAYEPCPLLEAKVDAEAYGTKSGEGFYEYDDGSGVDVPPDEGRADVERRLLAVMANEVAALVEGDVAAVDDVDEAVTLGAGFPEGPAKLADDAGLDVLVATLDDRYDETGADRYVAREYLRTLADSGRGFHDADPAADDPAADDPAADDAYDTLDVTVRDGVAHLTLDRPHRLNTITLDVLADLDAAIDAFEADDAVRAVLLSGAGDRAFSAGADVQSMASEADPLSAVELSRRGQAVFGRLQSCSVPVVAAIDGYCLGGGMELATCADLRVAGVGAEFSQPEHDLGLMPGWGGTQRLSHIVGEGRAKEIILTAGRYDAETMASYGFVNEVADPGETEARAMDLASDLAAGPPVAQRFTKRAMHRGRDDTEAGLELEAQGFGHLFDTDDLMEGIAAFAADRDPEFTGE